MAEGRISNTIAVIARGLWLLLAATVVVAALAIAALLWLDRPSGQAFVLRQLAGIKLQSGLTVNAGRIEGSLFNTLTVYELKLGDPKGVFAEIPRAEIDWRPRDLLGNLLTIRSAHAAEIRVLRLPHLLPTDDPNILPDIDIAIGDLRVDRLVLAPAVAGKAHVIALAGKADIRSGRALVDLNATAAAGDVVRIKLDTEPDRDRFDVDAVLDAPVGGVIDGLAQLHRPLHAAITGDGSWRDWRGRIDAATGKSPLAALALTAAKGDFNLRGSLTPGLLLTGPAARLVTPQVNVTARARLADRVAQTELHLDSAALRLDAAGQLDFAAEKLGDVRVEARLLSPAALHPKLAGRDVRLAARVAGSFARPLVDYVLSAAQVSYGTTVLTNVRAAGIAELGRTPLVIPVAASAARITGVGATAEPLLTNVRIEAPLRIANGLVQADAITLHTDRLTARGTGQLALATGDLDLRINATLPRYVVPNTGIADLSGEVRIISNARGIAVSGPVQAVVTRLDNQGLGNFLGGLPRIGATIDLAPDLSLRFTNARLVTPALTLTGNGSQSAAGVLQVSADGNLRDYGPVKVSLTGPADRPVIELALARPGLGIDLSKVAARIAPAAGGWSFNASAASAYGPIAADGVVRTAAGPLVIDLTNLSAAGLRGAGSATATAAGPFAGRFDLRGPGITGALTLSAAGTTQRADVALDAKAAKLALDVPVTIGEGHLVGVALLPASGSPSADAKLTASKVRRGDNELTTLTGDLRYANGAGQASFKTSGNAGSPFSLAADARLNGDNLVINGGGNIDGRDVRLSAPAQLTRRGGSWVLAPTVITTADGRAEVSGSFGADFALHTRLDRVGLSLLSVINPALDFSGSLSGTVDVAFPAGGSLPNGTASLRINGLSRAGFATASTRIDMGINAVIANGGASARAVIGRGGKIEGRAQAQLPVIPGGRADPLLTRLFASPLIAQLRWSGPAQALWPLTGIESIDLRGPVAVAADIGGVLGDPSFSGTVTTEGARVESTAIGLVIDKISLVSRFSNSRLDVSKFSGSAGKDGTISGSGGIDLSAVRSFPLDFKLDLNNAQVLNRDDLNARVTGPVHIENGANGARISGKLNIDKARITIGGASVEDVPVLAVTEINRDPSRRALALVAKPTIWQLDLAVHANNKVDVRGMGLDSEWSGDLKVGGSASAPQLVGKVQLVRGDYDFAGKRFTLTRGDVRFNGSYPPDPTINVTAENSTSNLTATLTITGTAQRPQIAFGSVPALPEDEVLSRVLFGESITNLSAPEALQLAGALASLRGGSGGLNPINMVRKGLGIDRLRILPADTVKGRKTSVAAGQYIGDRVYVEVTSDAQGYNATSVEVSLTRTLSILSEIATLGGNSVNLRWKRDY